MNVPSPAIDRGRTLVPLLVWLLWLACTVYGFWFVRSYGSPLPYNDEWYYVGEVVGEVPITLQWIWQQHNEHRIPWAKLTFVPILRLGNFDYRVLMYFNVGVLASAAAILLLASRQAAGQTRLLHAIYPLMTLSLNQENHLWGFQIAFCQFAWFTSVLFALAITRPREKIPAWRIVVLGLMAWLLPGTGGPGLGLLPGVLLWLLIEGFLAFRERRWGATSLAGLFVLGGVAWMVLYFQLGYDRIQFISTPRTPFNVLRAMLLFVGNAPGAFQQALEQPGEQSLPIMGSVMGLLILLAVGYLVVRRRQVGMIWLPLLALAIGLAGITAGIGYSRVGGIFATAPRYGTLALPWAWWLVVVASTLPQRPARIVHTLLLLAAVWAYFQAASVANEVGKIKQAVQEETNHYLHLQAPLSVVLNQIARTRETPNLEELSLQLLRLQQAKAKMISGARELPEPTWDGPELPVPEPLTGAHREATVTLAVRQRSQAIRLQYEVSPGYVSLIVIGRRGPEKTAVFSRWIVCRNVEEPQGTAILWLGPEHAFDELAFGLLTRDQTCRIVKIETSGQQHETVLDRPEPK